MIDYVTIFNTENLENIQKMNDDPQTAVVVNNFVEQVAKYQYGYHRTWMGRPVIQYPQDLISMQEIIMQVKPDLIIETGIAHGGSVVFNASMLELLGDLSDIRREVVAIDIEIRPHNRSALEEHPLYNRITMLEGSSTAPNIVAKVREIAANHKTILVMLDSNHTHDHVYEELKALAPLVTIGSYVIVFDTCVEFFSHLVKDRPWSKGNNPHSAAQKFLSENPHFVCDESFDRKSLLTAAPQGWLKRIS
jgi:cephalosporin hydroxylase